MRTSSGGLPHRRSVRLTPSSYRDATVFITICSDEKRCTFGRVENDHVLLSPLGEIVNREWLRSKTVRPDVLFDEYTIMPNHMHALVCVPTADGSRSSLASLVRGFKGAVTRAAGREVWQRGYHEHIVRDERELEIVRTYIQENPIRWTVDRYHMGE